MPRTNNRCVESLNISIEVAICGKFSQIHPDHSHLSVTKNDSSRLNNLFMVRYPHIRMSSYAKNKQQMCCVTQHQCRSRQMWKIFTYGDFYTDVEWLNTSVVCSWHKRTSLWVEHYHEQIVQTRRVIFCNRQKWVLWMKLWKFSTFGDIYTDVEWLNTSVVCS